HAHGHSKTRATTPPCDRTLIAVEPSGGRPAAGLADSGKTHHSDDRVTIREVDQVSPLRQVPRRPQSRNGRESSSNLGTGEVMSIDTSRPRHRHASPPQRARMATLRFAAI